MPKPSARDRAELLTLAAAVADGESLRPRVGGERAIAGLRVIAALSQRLGNLSSEAAPMRASRPALFQWGHLDVIEVIGEGTSAEVFRAYDPLLDIEVALKLSRPSLGRRATAEWIAEARRLARLRHPNVVAVHGVDVHAGRAGLWLDLVDGETLLAYGERRGPMPARELCLTGIELCKGLSAIHLAGLLHRDLKPANLLRESNGRILITDFGAAGSAALAGGELSQRGTPLTMAPEIIEGGSASVASDLYSLGVVLHWLATGRLPVIADDIDDLREQHRRRARQMDTVRIDGASESLSGLVQQLLAGAADARPGDAHDVERRLAQELDALAATSKAPPRRTTTLADSPGIDFERIVAREAELAWLRQEQRRAFMGRAHPVFLVGDSGTGKSTLIRGFGDWLQSRDGRLIHIALGGYSPGRRRLMTLLERAADPSTNRTAATDDVTLSHYMQALLAQTPALVICFDDLEYADDSERAQIRQLFADLRGSSALCIACQRVEGHPESDVVRSLFGDDASTLLMLEPFTAAQSEGAINSLLGVPTYDHDIGGDALALLHRLSGGNPFFLTELLRHLQATGALTVDHGQRHWQLHGLPETLPASLELAAQERCRALHRDTHDVLAAAAVIGERFRVETLQQLLPRSAARIEQHIGQAIVAGLVECVSDDTLRFRHGLIQRVLYDSLTVDARRKLHSICVALLRDHDHPEAASWLSLHAERAGDVQTAFTAGFDAMMNPRLPEMAEPRQCERLRELVDSGARATTTQRFEIELRRIRGLCSAGLLREAIGAAELLQQTSKRAVGSTVDLRLRVTHAHVAFAFGRHADAIALLAPLLDGDRPPPRTQRALVEDARLLTVRAQAALGEYRIAEHVIVDALAKPARNTAIALELRALHGWCLALQGRLREADDVLDRALRQAANASAAQRADVLRRMHWVKLCRGRYQQAYALALSAHTEFRAAGDAMGQAKMSMSLGQTRLMQGLPEEASGFFNRTVLRLETIGDHHCEAETVWMLGRAYTELGRYDEADTHLARALELIAHVGDRDDEFRFLIERARLRLAQGRAAEAFDSATAARAIALELDSQDGAAFAEVEMAAAQLALGRVAEALALCEPAAHTLRSLEAGERWRADWLLGCCRRALDPDSADAAAAFTAAATAIEHTIAELDPSDHPRRERIRQIRRAQLEAITAGGYS